MYPFVEIQHIFIQIPTPLNDFFLVFKQLFNHENKIGKIITNWKKIIQNIKSIFYGSDLQDRFNSLHETDSRLFQQKLDKNHTIRNQETFVVNHAKKTICIGTRLCPTVRDCSTNTCDTSRRVRRGRRTVAEIGGGVGAEARAKVGG